MEPTRNAWVPLAAWFRRQGANVVLVSAERSADLRAYYAKHTKSDRLDSVLLARLPLWHPEGLHAERGLGPRGSAATGHQAALDVGQTSHHQPGPSGRAAGDPRTRLARRVQRRSGQHDPAAVPRRRLRRPAHRQATRTFPPDPVLPTPLPWCLGRTRGDTIIAAAKATLELWGDELELADLADDIAIEARLALTLTQEI